MPNRITGMYSGMDTESLIRDLIRSKRTKVDDTTKNKTKLEWKQEKWTALNKKIKNFYSKSVSNLRWSTTFMKKATTVSNPGAVSVITGESAMNSVQKLSVKKLASSGYLTGAKMESASDEAITKDTKVTELSFNGEAFSGAGSFSVTVNGKAATINVDEAVSIDNVVWQLNRAGVNANFDEKNGRIFIGATASGEKADFTITADNAAGAKALSALGINATPSKAVTEQYDKLASYSTYFEGATAADWVNSIQDAGVTSDIYKRVSERAKELDSAVISAKEAELAALSAEEEPDEDAIEALKTEIDGLKDNLENGIYSSVSMEQAATEMKERVDYAKTANSADSSTYNTGAVKLKGEDAVIELNGTEFTSSSNSFEVNGLTFTCNAVADDITVTTQNDTDGIYNVVKNFIKEYNDLIKEIDTAYNAEYTKLKPLTDDEKDAITESEAKKIEDKVRDSLLRKDETLGTIFSSLRDLMSGGITIGDETHYLSEFGIETPNYLNAAEGERYLFHIDGDADDELTGGNADKLKGMIANNPDFVVSFFTNLGRDLYSKLGDLSKASDDQTYGNFFQDKLLKRDIADYSSRISDMEDKISKEEDKLYKKFAAMEVAMSKMNSNSSYLSSLFTS